MPEACLEFEQLAEQKRKKAQKEREEREKQNAESAYPVEIDDELFVSISAASAPSKSVFPFFVATFFSKSQNQ